jgi:hypothetical protein
MMSRFKLTLNQFNAIAGVTGVAGIILLLNDLADLSWFGEYDPYVTLASFVLLGIALLFVGPAISALKLSFNQRRGIVGLIWLPTVIFLLNDFADLNWFGEYSRYLTAAGFALLLFAITFVAPIISEMEDRRAQRKKGTRSTQK